MEPLICTSVVGSPVVKPGEPEGFAVALMLLAITPGVRESSEYTLRLTRGRPTISTGSMVLPKWRYRSVHPQSALDDFWGPVLHDQRTVLNCTGSVVFA